MRTRPCQGAQHSRGPAVIDAEGAQR
jgi:hypothetical protein